MRFPSWLRSLLLWNACGLALLSVVAFFFLHPPAQLYYSPLALQQPYANLPTWGAQELYHNPVTRSVLFDGHRDRIVDWSVPEAHCLYRLVERLANWVAVQLPATVVPAPLHLLHLMQGPAQLQVLRTLTLLGVPDVLADRVLNLQDLHAAVIANAPKQEEMLRAGLVLDADAPLPSIAQLPMSKLERLMSFALSIGYFDEVSYRGSHIYVHNALSVVLRKDHPNNLNHLMLHFSNESYMAWHNLFHAITSPEDEGDIDVGAAPTGIDALLGGAYSTRTSIQALEENKRRREKTVAGLRTTLQSDAASTVAPAASVKTAWETTHSQSLWGFLRARPALERNFASAMSQIDHAVNRALVADYEWDVLRAPALPSSDNNGTSDGAVVSTPVGALVDMGGAEGSFLASVLSAHPSIPRGVLFDLDTSVTAARALWNAADTSSPYHSLASSRTIDLVAGDFFRPDSIPLPPSRTSATKYILRQILHDWSDAATLRILSSLRRRLSGYPNVAVVVIEVNKAEVEDSATRAWVDMHMLVCCNAKERTQKQWEVIFEATGWTMTGKWDTRSMFAVMEIQMDDRAAMPAASIANSAAATATPAAPAVAAAAPATGAATPAPAAPAVASSSSPLKQEL